MIEIVAKILFYALMGTFGVFSLIEVYILLRFGRSKILGLVLSAFYAILMLSLYAAALDNFQQIRFPQISI